ncbi:hypothetical protein Xen7305DRAFT_00013300 [Xenococcus sp. PCC 7305]|uniref:DUF4278 domain-containing protein n=1 Tax=Xenococcus sp. PCC 7305 TaxID=102125 RepID=UPI0002ABAF89|nr:DUF4278 domain-containing protein [Xenococcus sp. PCC 7305]ELS01625.1 hypothetical protein Xen7305DRAFT_00013300 [Xenococcus sp. PCC 7305]
MKLHFHGQTYDSPHIELPVDEGQVGGRYRGAQWRVHRVHQQQQRRQSSAQLTYRGVPYTKR